MKTTSANTEKLYLVCPICRTEHFINRNFGEGYFYTAPGAVFNFDPETVEALKDTVHRNGITELVWVGDSDCCFIHNVLDHTSVDLPCEKKIRSLHAHGDTDASLTHKLMKDQIALLKSEEVFGREIASGQLRLTSIITSGQHREVLSA